MMSMATNSGVLAVIFLAIIFSNSEARVLDTVIPQQAPLRPPLISIKFFILSVQWPNSNCQICRKPVPQFFTIHGLWPSLSADEAEKCRSINNPLTARDLDNPTLHRQLVYSWPSLEDSTSWPKCFDFLVYEWEKHGKCCNFLKLDYFTRTLHLAQMYQPLDKLKAANIIPGPQKLYSLTDIDAALHSGSRIKHSDIICKDGGGGGGVKIISEVRICFETDATTLKDWRLAKPNWSFGRSCTSTVKFP